MPSGKDTKSGPDEKFVSEPIIPVEGSADTAAMATGEPGLPSRFTWRGDEYALAAILRKWKESGPCHHGSGELYLRKHWYEILTTSGLKMTIYFERQPRSGKSKARWWLYTTSLQ
jgi:phosphoribosylglycinamide formyltransferase-1